jgi:hypothetical protein
MWNEGTKATVTETEVAPACLSIEAISKEKRLKLKQENGVSQRFAKETENPATFTGVSRLVVEPSPSCAKTHRVVSNKLLCPNPPPSSQQHQPTAILTNNKRHHLALSVVSPARHTATARKGTRMLL